MRIISIRAKNAFAQTGIASEICNRDSLQTQRPSGEQMKSRIPRKVIDARGGLEENDGLSHRPGFALRHLARHGGNLEIVEATDESAFDALGEEFVEVHLSL